MSTKRELRSLKIKALRNIKKDTRARRLASNVVDRLSYKAKHPLSESQRKYRFLEALLVAYELSKRETHKIPDAITEEITDVCISEIIFLVNIEAYNISERFEGIPFDYYATESNRYDSVKREVNEILLAISSKTRRILRKNVIKRGYRPVVNDLKALYHKDMSVFELFSNYTLQKYLAVKDPVECG